MFGSPLLDVVLTLAAVYAGLGAVCSALAEWLAAGLRWRADVLEATVRALLADARDAAGHDLADLFFDAPLVRPLGGPAAVGGRRPRRPSYLPARAFTDTVLQLIHPADWPGGEPPTFNDLARIVERLPDSDLKDTLRAFARASGHDADRVRAQVDAWFNAAMDRAAGVYKRRVGAAVVALAAVLSIALGIDTVEIGRTAWRDAQQRAARADLDALVHALRPPAAPAADAPAVARAPADTKAATGSADPGAAHAAPPPADRPKPADPPPAPAKAKGPAAVPDVWEPPAGGYPPAVFGPDYWQLASRLGGLFLSTLAIALAAALEFDVLNRLTNGRLCGPRP